MRKLAAVVVALLVLIGVIAFAAFKFDVYLQSNREWLAQRAGAALGREVQFDQVSVSLRGGLAASVGGLRIGEAAGFGEGPFLEVARARVVVAPWPALRGEYEMSRIVLEEPQIHIVRTAKGFNVETLGAAASPPRDAAQGGGTPKSRSPVPFLVSHLRIDDGRILYSDRTASPRRSLELVDVDVEVAGIGGAAPVRIDAAARWLDERQHDIRFAGTVGPLDPAAPMAAVLDLEATLGPLAIDRVKQNDWLARSVPRALTSADPLTIVGQVSGTVSAPAVVLALDATDAAIRYGEAFAKPSGVALRLDGRIERVGSELRIDDGRLELAEALMQLTGSVRTAPAVRYDLRLTGDAVPLGGWERLLPALAGYDLDGKASPDLRLSGGDTPKLAGKIGLAAVAMARDAVRVSDLTAAIGLDGDRLTVPPTRFQLNGAPVEIGGSYEIDRQAFQVSGAVTGLALGPLLDRYAPQVARVVDGLLDADIELSGRGASWETIREQMTGGGAAKVRNGLLRQLNVAEEVLAGLTGLEGLTTLLSPRLRAAHPGLLQARDTPFDAMGGHVRIADERVTTEDFALAAQEHAVTGSGWISFEGAIDLQATFVAAPALSTDLIGGLKEAHGLLDEQGRMVVPFRLAGMLPGARPQPDVDYIVRRIGRSALESGLDRLFGGKDSDTEGSAAKDGEATPKPKAAERLLRRGLESLFGR